MHKYHYIVALGALLGFALPAAAEEHSSSATLEFESVIAGYEETVARIIESARAENDGYLKLQELCDDIGHRLSGSESHAQAIAWAEQTLRRDGHENVKAEEVMVPKWVRGKESCRVVEPRPMRIEMLGLGGSIGTSAGGIQAEVIVVDDREELDQLADDQVQGKIVVFNCAMPPYSEIDGSGYGRVVRYRGNGATWAAERGAVAALVRSCTAYSLVTPHTGAMSYRGGVEKIPAAAITIEAAMMLRRWQDRGKQCVVELMMEAHDEGEVPSANVMGEIVGSERPEEIIVIGGHIDSWDVGQGAQDDGGGCVAAMEALNILRKLELRPRRTIRVVLWTNEENGIAGAKDYLNRHRHEKHVAGIESDSGVYRPKGLSVDMQDERKALAAQEQLASVMSLLKPLGAHRVNTGYSGVDVGLLKEIGAVCMGLEVDGRLYFNQHHTWADTVDKVNPADLTECAITMAVAAYVVADLPVQIGK